jgi:TnpA family transposase
MASIERTAYPRFKRHPTAAALNDLYTPSAEELAFAIKSARSDPHQLTFLSLLKSFQRLGYFPRLEDIPRSIINHLHSCLRLKQETQLGYDEPRTLYRHYRAIRDFLQVKAYGKEARHSAIRAVYDAAQVMDNPADLINVALEMLIKERYELPAFSTLDRLARRVRTLVNRRFLQTVLSRLSESDIARLDLLLLVDERTHRSPYHRLKQLPKQPTLSHLQEWLDHLEWLTALGDIAGPLAGLPHLKVKHFAAEAKALDAGEMKDFLPAKRYTLLICLIRRMRVQARDSLAAMFIKRLSKIQQKGKEELDRLRLQYKEKTTELVSLLADVVTACENSPSDEAIGQHVRSLLMARGSTSQLLEDCEAVAAYNADNYQALLWRYYRTYRRTLFGLVRQLSLSSTSQDQSLIKALKIVLDLEARRSEWLSETVDLSFASERWQRTVCRIQYGELLLSRRHLEVCVFVHLAAELKSGDVSIEGSEEYADYRQQLLSWAECEPLVADYARELGFAQTAPDFVTNLRSWLQETARAVDSGYPENAQLVLDEKGKPALKRQPPRQERPSIKALEALLLSRLPERNVIDILAYVDHYTSWTRHFGPLSGADPKLDQPIERYILTAFAYGCNLGPAQAARHMRGTVTPHMLSFVNRRHIDAQRLNAALCDVINHYAEFPLPKLWGAGKTAAADGTKYELYDQNLLAEYHIRYGGYGGIAYHHVADNYVALFSHFIPCGVWEAIYIIEGLLQNQSAIQPDTLHADTQGQSTPVFALAYLLGIKLMPRIRNWHDLVLYRPDKDAIYQHIDPLFGEVIEWRLIETHWQDLLRVVLSIQAGRISSVTLLRKLGNYSRKNRLYQAFRELGRVVRTVFLLQFLSDANLRQQITESTNKVEAYNGFAKWLFFGGEGVIADNDPEEQEKAIKYNDLVANAVILQNVIDQSRILYELKAEGHSVKRADVAALSPYLTKHLKRFGDYVIDLSVVPQPLSEKELELEL